MHSVTFVHRTPLVCQVSVMLIVKFAKEDVVLYCQLNAVYLGRWKLLSGLTIGLYRNKERLQSNF